MPTTRPGTAKGQVEVERAAPHVRRFTPADLGFNPTWPKGGTNSLDLNVEGLRMLSVYALSDEFFSMDISVYNETNTAIIFTRTNILGGLGTNNGQVQWSYAFFGEFDAFWGAGVVWYSRIRFRGKGTFAAAPNSRCRVFGSS